MAEQEQKVSSSYSDELYETDGPHHTGTESMRNNDATIAVVRAENSSTDLFKTTNHAKEKQRKDDVVQPQPSSANEVPNGGLKAWLQVFGAHLMFFNSW